MANVDIQGLDLTLKDIYALPGTRLKQWVVDLGRELDWDRETCPRFDVAVHDDNTGIPCRNGGSRLPWAWLDHDCCYECGDLHEHLRSSPSVKAWLAEKAARPPIEADRTKLSDQIQPDFAMTEHPFFKVFER